MHMKSIWQSNCKIEKRRELTENLETEVVIIGGGMTGILTAYLLQNRGIPVIVLEKDRIAQKTTKNTTAKITSQHNIIYHELINKIGRKQAQQYAKANQMAIEQYADIIESNHISCDFTPEKAFVYSTQSDEKIRKEVWAANQLGIPAFFTKKTTLPFPVKGAVCFPEQASFHPLKFVDAISQNLTIYENSAVIKVNKDNILTKQNKIISAKHIVIATHYPIIDIPGYYFLRMYQQRSYVLALENAPLMNGMYIGEGTSGYSFRNYQNYLLFGGQTHRTGMQKNDEWMKLTQEAKRLFPKASVYAKWAAQDCMTFDSIPYIGPFSSKFSNVYIATGFNKWGMTGAMTASNIISDRICGIDTPLASVFSPKRNLGSADVKKLMVHFGHSIAGLSQGLITEKEHRCTHMGCKLKKNLQEDSWDCPCHGSRFDSNGNVIDSPAVTELKNEKS